MVKKIVYLKLTNRCQLTCQHCYNSVCEKIDMSEETLEKATNFICNIAGEHEVEVSLHGGEPMLYKNLTHLNQMVDKMKAANVYVSATTNLVYQLTEELKELFHKFTQQDGEKLLLTSYDVALGRFSYDQRTKWINNVKELIAEGIDVQPIMSLHKLGMKYYSTPAQLLFFYKHELGLKRCNFERLTRSGKAEDNANRLIPTNREVEDWLIKLYEANKLYNLEIPLLLGLEDAIDGYLTGCRARQCTQNVITINPDGTIATCPNMPLDIVKDLDGNVYADKTLHICNMETIRHHACFLCEHFHECNGDCFQLSWDDTGCPGLPKLISKMKEDLNKNG